jgi:hypothetical protein
VGDGTVAHIGDVGVEVDVGDLAEAVDAAAGEPLGEQQPGPGPSPVFECVTGLEATLLVQLVRAP